MPFVNDLDLLSNPIVTATHTAINVTNVTGIVLAANSLRRWLLIVNDSDTPIWIKFAVPAVINEGIRINANGGALELTLRNGNLPWSNISAIHNAGAVNKVLLITEGV